MLPLSSVSMDGEQQVSTDVSKKSSPTGFVNVGASIHVALDGVHTWHQQNAQH
jgi:hypothetical protein